MVAAYHATYHTAVLCIVRPMILVFQLLPIFQEIFRNYQITSLLFWFIFRMVKLEHNIPAAVCHLFVSAQGIFRCGKHYLIR